MTLPLHQLHPQTRFSDRAEDYAKYRPSYPAAAISEILAEFSDLGKIIIADIGAGTGIASRLLADRGVRVIAIEPNQAMREAATLHPSVEFRAGDAENTNLADNSVDLVTCFQSFHWFNLEPTLVEFSRILKPGGRLIAVWNNRDRTDQFTAAYSHLTKKASCDRAELPMESQRFLSSNAWFPQVDLITFPYHQSLDRQGLLGRALSTSYIPKQGEVYEQLVRDLNQIYEQYRDAQGLVNLQYQTNVYRAYAS